MAALIAIESVVRSARVEPFELSLTVAPRRQLFALRGGQRPIIVQLAREAAPGAVRITVLSRGDLGDDALIESEVQRAIDDASALAGLDEDPADFGEVALRHPLVTKLYRRFAGARLGRVPTVWQAFATSVVEQLVTSQEARDSLRRMRARFGQEASAGLVAFPTAAVMAKVAPFELRALGVGMRRATTLIMGARLADRLERLRGVPVPEAMTWLQQLKGVGVWTANKVAMDALGHADGVLVGDSGAPFVATMALTGIAGGDDEMLACLAPFSPHRARVARLFDLARVHLGGVPGVPKQRLPVIDPHRRTPWKWW